MQYDMTCNNDAWILTLAMLAQALRKRELTSGTFRLGVGLPISAYKQQREAMRAYFMTHKAENFVFCGEEYSIVIENCYVYPQGYAAYLTQYNELANYNNITHVDIGGYTVDLFRTQGGRLVPDSKKMTSIPNGTISMLRAIQSELARNDIHLTESEITAAMQGGRVEHVRAEEASLAIHSARDRYVQDLCNTLREYGIDTQTPINLIGGGAELLSEALKECMYVVGTADLFANARGYALWLEREI